MENHVDKILGINLEEYVYKIGYTQASKKSTNWVNMKNPSTGDEIKISRKKNLYSNNDAGIENLDRGNIIHFVANRLNNVVIALPKPLPKDKLSETFKILKKEINEIEIENLNPNKIAFNLDEKKTLSPEKNITEYVKDKIKNLKEISFYAENYLKNHRSINPETIHKPIFAGMIKESPVLMANGKMIANIAFIKKSFDQALHEKTIGFVTHFHDARANENVKRVYETQDGIWRSNILEESKNIIYSESAIDCFSHCEMINPKNAIYASIEGQISDEKCKNLFELYQKTSEKEKEVSLTSITDNDYAGTIYDLKLAIHFNNELQPEKPIETLHQENYIKYVIHGNYENIDFGKIKEEMAQYIRLEAPKHSQFFLPYLNVGQTKNFAFFEVRCKKESLEEKIKVHHFLKPLIKTIFKINNINFYQHKSKSKDWNDDLKIEKQNLNVNLKKKMNHNL